jgi:hypothetical protein
VGEENLSVRKERGSCSYGDMMLVVTRFVFLQAGIARNATVLLESWGIIIYHF